MAENTEDMTREELLDGLDKLGKAHQCLRALQEHRVALHNLHTTYATLHAATMAVLDTFAADVPDIADGFTQEETDV